MSTAFRLKTFFEIFSNMLAHVRVLLEDPDLLPGSVLRTILESAALQDADQYIQISRLLDLFSLDKCVGDDLDSRAVDLGANVYTDLRRRPANTSISKIIVGDGTLASITQLIADINVGDHLFTVADASAFPSSGVVLLDPGTASQEQVIYKRGSGNAFTILSPSTGLVFGHSASGNVLHASTQSTLVGSMTIGQSTVALLAGTGSAWKTSGSVILERDTVRQERIAFTRSGDTLTLTTPVTFAHAAGSSLVQSTTGSTRTITAGLTCYVPATTATRQINFTVLASGTLLDGDFVSGLIDVQSIDVGVQTLAGANTITKWNSPPFSGATVTNPIAATRGSDREKDDSYRQRIKDFLQSLTRATPLAITTLTSGLLDPVSNRSVAFSQIIEPVVPGASDLYITDGSESFSLTQVPFLGRDTIISDAEAGDQRGRLSQYGPFSYGVSPASPRLFKSTERGSATTVGVNYLEDTGKALTVNAYVGYFLKTDDNQFYEITANSGVRFTLNAAGVTPSLGSYSIYNLVGSPLVPGTDFTFNEAVGDLELTTPLVAHDGLVAASDGASPSVGAYLYTTGLGAYVQRAVNGDPTAFLSFPGIRAAGTKVVVKVPNVVGPTLTVKVTAGRGFSDAQLAPSVKTAVQTYVNSLGIGANIILSEIIRAVKSLPGIDDVSIIDPVANLTITKSQIARITDANVVVV